MKMIARAAKRRSRDMNSISPAANRVLSTVLIVLSLLFTVPLLLVISISFSSKESIAHNGYRFIPEEWSITSYKYLVEIGDNLWHAYGMTIFYTVVGTVLSLFVMSMYAYVLSRKEFKLRNAFAFYTFFTTLFSGGLVPQYILFTRYLHINNTIWVFIIPSIVNAFYVIILRTFISTTIPDSLFDAAKLDGANEWQIYTRVVLPLFKPGLASIGLFTVVNRWNDWFTGLMYTNDRKLIPVMTFLQKIQRNIDLLKSGSPAAVTVQGMQKLKELPSESARMAITIIAVLPLLIMYPFFQKYFIKGLTVGSVKG